MKKTNPHLRRFCMAAAVLILPLTLSSAALADTDGNTPKITRQPDQLVLQLGTRWSGVEFELRTDAGLFPVPVVVDENGILTMDLGGSTIYTLSCLESSIPIPDPSPAQPPVGGPAPSEPDPAPIQEQEAEPVRDRVPVWPMVVFLVGLTAIGGGFAAFQIYKRRERAVYDDWDEDDDVL